jgi:hypothetical protein
MNSYEDSEGVKRQSLNIVQRKDRTTPRQLGYETDQSQKNLRFLAQGNNERREHSKFAFELYNTTILDFQYDISLPLYQ